MRNPLFVVATVLALLWSTGFGTVFAHVAHAQAHAPEHEHDGNGDHEHCAGCIVASSPALAPSGPTHELVADGQSGPIRSTPVSLRGRTAELSPPGRAPPTLS